MITTVEHPPRPLPAGQLTFEDAITRGVKEGELCAKRAGDEFKAQAMAFVPHYLAGRERASGEEISMACKEAGIAPHDDRAFGAVYLALLRAGKIEKCGFCRRMRGHGTGGGNLWRVRRQTESEEGMA